MPQNTNVKVLTVSFYKSPAGNEPVRDWLKLRTPEEKKAIGEDIKAVEYTWPVGYLQKVYGFAAQYHQKNSKDPTARFGYRKETP